MEKVEKIVKDKFAGHRSIRGLRFLQQSVDKYIWETEYGHVSVNRDTGEVHSTASGFMGTIELEDE